MRERSADSGPWALASKDRAQELLTHDHSLRRPWGPKSAVPGKHTIPGGLCAPHEHKLHLSLLCEL